PPCRACPQTLLSSSGQASRRCRNTTKIRPLFFSDHPFGMHSPSRVHKGVDMRGNCFVVFSLTAILCAASASSCLAQQSNALLDRLLIDDPRSSSITVLELIATDVQSIDPSVRSRYENVLE